MITAFIIISLNNRLELFLKRVSEEALTIYIRVCQVKGKAAII